MEEDFDEALEEEEEGGGRSLPTGRDAVAPGKGILLLPHRQLHPHSQLLKARPYVDQEPRVLILPPQAAAAAVAQMTGQDHGDWTYEEQFRQVSLSPSTSLGAPWSRPGIDSDNLWFDSDFRFVFDLRFGCWVSALSISAQCMNMCVYIYAQVD